MLKATIAFIGIAAIAILLFLICGNFVCAAETGFEAGNQTVFASIAKQIEEIQKKIDLLWMEYFKMVEASPVIAEIQNRFKNNMSCGSTGEDVRNLQALLADLSGDGDGFYPERLITGYFGKLTEAAVKRFQKQYYLDETGIVDFATRRILNDLYFVKTERDWFEKTKL